MIAFPYPQLCHFPNPSRQTKEINFPTPISSTHPPIFPTQRLSKHHRTGTADGARWIELGGGTWKLAIGFQLDIDWATSWPNKTKRFFFSSVTFDPIKRIRPRIRSLLQQLRKRKERQKPHITHRSLKVQGTYYADASQALK